MPRLVIESQSPPAVSQAQVTHYQKWAWIKDTAMSSSYAGRSGGWYPKDTSTGDMPVVELVIELWAYSIQARCVHQVEGLLTEISIGQLPGLSWLILSDYWFGGGGQM